MAAELSLKIKTKREELVRVTSAVEDIAAQDGWPDDLVFRVNLVLEEVSLNIMDNAFDGGLHEFDVTLISDARSVTIQVVDAGRPFDPLTESPPPDLDSPVEHRPVGGLGVHLIRTMMDKTVYRRTDGQNRLTLVKHRTELDRSAE